MDFGSTFFAEVRLHRANQMRSFFIRLILCQYITQFFLFTTKKAPNTTLLHINNQVLQNSTIFSLGKCVHRQGKRRYYNLWHNYHAVKMTGTTNDWGKHFEIYIFWRFFFFKSLYISWFSERSKACFGVKLCLKCPIKLELQVSELKLYRLLVLKGDRSLF